MPENRDIRDAAALLIGIYGDDAADYAHTRMEALEEKTDAGELKTWALITAEIGEILCTCREKIRLH